QLPEQGEYDLTLRVQDSLGRTVSEYTLNGESTASVQLPVLVDLEQPQILNVHTVQQPLAPEEGKYFIRATADIVDLNLDSSKIISILDNGVEQIAAFNFSAPPDHSDTYSFDFNVAPGNYNLIIKAADLAGNEKISSTESIVVEPWTVPTMSMSVRDPDGSDIGGGKAIWLDLQFSEAVDGFSLDDLAATAAMGDEAGVFGEFEQLSATHWQVRYTAPAGVDTDISIQVAEGSYTSADDYMAGSEANLSLTVIGSPLTTNISFQDGNTQVIKGEIIQVTIVFNRSVLTEPVLTPANTESVSFWSAVEINADRTAFTFELDTTELDFGEIVIGVEAGDQDQYGNMGQSVTAMLTVN
ncbi:Ig-like domain-containing protein, partial [Photobacterium halotolerans]|uniref:Ig-like domain-containing protein n=1 Tax=Photobacterium halotolerans TaxID=265726 RepID=UPI0004898B67